MNALSQTQLRTLTLREALHEAVDLYAAGRFDECRNLCNELLQQQPRNSHTLHLLGVLEIQRGDLDAAVPFFEQALSIQEPNAEFHSNYGSLLTQLKRFPDAEQHLRRAIELKADYPEPHINLGSLLMKKLAFAEALDAFQRALALNPMRDDAHTGAGCAHKQLLQLPEAVGAFRRAIAIDPDNAEAQCNLALVLLQCGAFREGWQKYEWRFRSKNWGTRTFRQPRWNGENLAKQKILIPCEQGLGDTIQFIRYLPALKRLGPKIVFECPPALKPILNGFPGIDLLIDWPRSSDVERGVDCYVPLMSLPMHFDTTFETIPDSVPYLSAVGDMEKWKQRLNCPGTTVGLVWSGNPANPMDHFRSCKLADFSPLAAIDGVHFFSLQKGTAAEQAAQPPAPMTLVNIDEYLTDFGETACALALLDLVITVDTSVAHLAGAMGRPVWLLLPFSPDFRWMLVREDSPWYPTMRLFRQNRCGDWAELFQRVADALRDWSVRRKPQLMFQKPISLQNAIQHYREGRYDDTERACLDIIAQQPNHVEALHLLANVLFQNGRIEQSLEFANRAAQLRPGDSHFHFNLGISLVKLGRLDEAEVSYRRALAVSPDNAEAHFNLANLCRDRQRTNDALRHYEQAIKANPNYLKARINLANLLRQEGRLDEAITQYRQAIRLQPRHAKAHYNLALTLQLIGNLEEALMHAETAAKHEPSFAEYQNAVGNIVQELRRTENATRP